MSTRHRHRWKSQNEYANEGSYEIPKIIRSLGIVKYIEPFDNYASYMGWHHHWQQMPRSLSSMAPSVVIGWDASVRMALSLLVMMMYLCLIRGVRRHQVCK